MSCCAFRLTTAAAVVGLMALSGPVGAAPDLRLPFPAGETWSITRAYNTEPTHVDYGGATSDDRYAVDFVEAGCDSLGKPILAADSGTVTVPPYGSGYGNAVLVDHGSGWVSRYAHLDSVYVSTGQSVRRGERLGIIGNSGNVSGTACPSKPGMHLHFALYHNGVAALPEPISGYTNLVAGISVTSDNQGPDTTTLGDISSSLQAGQWAVWSLDLSSSDEALIASISQLSGDLDLYLWAPGITPSSTNYTCRPFSGGTAPEECYISAPSTGMWHIGVNAAQAGSFRLLVESLPPPTVQYYSASGSLTTGFWHVYSLPIATDTLALRARLEGLTADLDLFVWDPNTPVSSTTYTCRPFAGGTAAESCEFPNPTPGTWYFGVNAAASGSYDLELMVTE